jgi:DNA-binding transcriptional LysR family regulator
MACSPRHRLAGKGKIDPSDLAGEKFVAFEASVPTRRHIDRLLKAEKVQVNVVMEFDNIELLKRAIEVNAGLSILPREDLERETKYGDLTYVRFRDDEKWVRPVAILRRRGRAPSPAERMFLAILRSKP